MNPRNILFIHGFGGGNYEFKPIQKFLLEKFPDQINFYDFEYPEKFGQISLEKIAEKLQIFIRENLLEKNFDVIAISQGGIIWRIFANKNKEVIKAVGKVFTLCTPHQGSLLANILRLPGIKDLRKNSGILRKINNEDDGLDYYAVYNPLDLMVFPGSRAKFNKAKENLCVWDLLHPLTFWNKKTLNFILNKIKEN